MAELDQGAEGNAASEQPIATVIETPEPWKRVVKTTIARSFFDEEYTGRLKKAVKSHKKPGFRPGKTPRTVVEKEMGDMLRMETVEALVPKAWVHAVVEHKLHPITDPALENLEFDEGQPLKFDLVCEVRPEVEIGDLEGIQVRKRLVEVTDQEVTEVLDRLAESRAAYEKVDRAAKEEDQILLDLEPQGDAALPEPDRVIEDQRFVLGSENNMAAFNEGLLGCSAGDQKDVTVIYPEDHPNETLKGTTVTFRCRIKEVAEKTVPVVDDEFAGAVAEGKNLDDLKVDIRKDLEKEAHRRVEQELDGQIQAELIARHDVPLPPSMVDRYLKSGLEEMHRRNAQTGRPATPEDEELYLSEGKPHAEKALKAMLLMEALRAKEDIKVSAEDVDERIEAIALENGFEVDRYREFVNSGEEKGRIEYDLLERCTYDFLLSRAEILEVPADTDVSPE